jgi:choline dehydrogenase-like flavoprotein
MLFYQATKEMQLGDRQVVVPSGGVLGGGSSTNLMMYSRAQRSDFDSWGVPGWSADEMLPYLKKVCFDFWATPQLTHRLT